MSGRTPGPSTAELRHLQSDLCDFLRHVIDMAKGDAQWDVVRLNAEALLHRDALNARLIAAAPDLLAALQTIRKRINEGDLSRLWTDVDDAARAAIAKATGATP